MSENLPNLTDEERAIWAWQMWSPGFGEEGQRKLKGASVMVSRCGGLGSVVAYELAAAGVGHLVLAHAGNVKPSDLNRQLLMTHDWLGKPRIESVERRLLELNPRLKITAVGENVNADNVERLVGLTDVVVDAAPLYEERLAMHDEALRQGKPFVECGMFDLKAVITSIRPGGKPCLRCLIPEVPPAWKREFPVFGAVSGTVACMGAMEAIKIISGIGEPLYGRLVEIDLRTMRFREMQYPADEQCPYCGNSE